MKFILCVEGGTERNALPQFLRRWLNPPRLSQKIGIQMDNLGSGAKLLTGIRRKVNNYLTSASADDIIAVIALIDLYGQTYPSHCKTVDEKCKWLVNKVEKEVNQTRFRMFCAVHETEAWLMSQPKVFPRPVADALRSFSRTPETVDFDHPPSRLLARLYREKLHGRYKYNKIVDGAALFRRLDPEVAYSKCPWLRKMLNEMLRLAHEAIGE